MNKIVSTSLVRRIPPIGAASRQVQSPLRLAAMSLLLAAGAVASFPAGAADDESSARFVATVMQAPQPSTDAAASLSVLGATNGGAAAEQFVRTVLKSDIRSERAQLASAGGVSADDAERHGPDLRFLLGAGVRQ